MRKVFTIVKPDAGARVGISLDDEDGKQKDVRVKRLAAGGLAERSGLPLGKLSRT